MPKAINRRGFLKSAGAIGAGLGARRLLPLGAAGSALFSGNAGAVYNYDDLDIQFDTSLTTANMPRVIHVFLYGGPSELAGNLSNIVDINANSQNPYGGAFDPQNTNTIVTPNYFWRGAGGDEMEAMLAAGDMSIYRTMNRLKDRNRAHGICVNQNLVGNLDVYNPGMASTLAWIVQNNNPFRDTNGNVKDLSQVVFPFISFEGESKVFNRSELDIVPALKPIALNARQLNPYQRTNITRGSLDNGGPIDTAIEALARSVNDAGPNQLTSQSLIQRELAANEIDAKLGDMDTVTAPYNYGTGNFGTRLKAAVSLMLANEETLFISLGSGGLGGWDDHSEMLRRYPTRMQELMTAVQAAMNQINDSITAGVAHADKIVINVYGEFGRNVNLNESLGWDHGTNQNLYTFGGRGLAGRGRILGQIVGETVREGDRGVNRQFTVPTDNSYQFEPFAVGSSLFSYFGVTNPEVLTGEPPIADF